METQSKVRSVRFSIITKFTLFVALVLAISFIAAFFIIINAQKEQISNALTDKSRLTLNALKTPTKNLLQYHYQILDLRETLSSEERINRNYYFKKLNQLNQDFLQEEKFIFRSNRQMRQDSQVDDFYIVDRNGKIIFHRIARQKGKKVKSIQAIRHHLENVSPHVFYRLSYSKEYDQKKNETGLTNNSDTQSSKEKSYNQARASIPVFSRNRDRYFYYILHGMILQKDFKIRRKFIENELSSPPFAPYWNLIKNRFQKEYPNKEFRQNAFPLASSEQFFQVAESVFRNLIIQRALKAKVQLPYQIVLPVDEKSKDRQGKIMDEDKLFYIPTLNVITYQIATMLIDYPAWYRSYRTKLRLYYRGGKKGLAPLSPRKQLQEWADALIDKMKPQGDAMILSWSKAIEYINAQILEQKIPLQKKYKAKESSSRKLAYLKKILPAKGAKLSVALNTEAMGRLVKSREQLGILVLHFVTREYNQRSAEITASMLDVALSIFLRIVLLSVIVSAFSSKSLKILGRGAYEIGLGNFDRKILLKSRDEFGQLADIINDMGLNLKKAQLEHDEKILLENELKQAAEIQQALLPGEIILPGLDKADYYKAESMSGGDYYDYFSISQDEIAWVVADVSGHGVGAAMVMAMARTLIREFARKTKSVSETMLAVNQILYEDTDSNYFVTAFLAIINIKDMKITYSSAGHNQTLLFNNAGKLSMLEGGGIPLGSFDRGIFADLLPEKSKTLKAGDILIQYSDGVTEAMNDKSEEYGLKRLQKVIASQAAASDPAKIMRYIINDLEIFTAAYPQSDDITLSILRLQA